MYKWSCVLLSSALMVSTASAAYASPINPALATDLCLDIAGGSSAAGTTVQIAHCYGNAAQDWSVSNGTLQALGMCLDVAGSNSANGTAVRLWNCNGTSAQQWTSSAGRILWAGAVGKCLDINAGNATDGQPMQIWDCLDNDSAQQWQTSLALPAASSTTAFQPIENTGLCMDVAGGIATNGAGVQIANCSANPAQRWTLTGGTVQALGKCLDVPGGIMTHGALVQLWDCLPNSGAQQWVWTGTNLQVAGQNLCLDIPNGNSKDGTRLQIWDCGGNNKNQAFQTSVQATTSTQPSPTPTASAPAPAAPAAPVATSAPQGGRTIQFVNQCSQTVWVALQNNGGKAIPSPSGFALSQGASGSVALPYQWGGRFWGRTGCQVNGNSAVCETGDCGGLLNCNGIGGQPTNLVEFLFDGWAGDTATQDYYDISNVDAFNLPLAITPVGGTGVCHAPVCSANILSMCPADLQVKNGQGAVVDCLSSCTKYQTDDTCCRGAHDTSATCPAPEGARVFKQACPDAYSYAYDDGTSTWNCTSPTGYVVTFCP